MKQKIIMITLLSAMIVLSACSTELDLSDEELKNNLINANSDLDSYSMNLDMDMDMEIKMQQEQMTINSKTIFEGAVDNENKKMFLEGEIAMSSLDMSETTYMSTYVIGNDLYVESEGQWFKMTDTNDIWSEQDQLQQTIELIESGTIKVLDEETINGNDYFVLEVTPDLEMLAKDLLNQNDLMNGMLEDINFEDLIKSYSLRVWINKNTYVIEKNVNEAELVLNAENFGEDEDGEITIKSTTEMNIHSINEAVEINLPQEAENAQEYNALQTSI